MSKKYKMLVFAYCEVNLGDDLFLKMLFERYKNVEWYVIESNNELITKIFRDYDVRLISRKDYLKNIFQFDGMINIGGSIFIQSKRWYGLYLKRLFYTIPLKLINKKVFILGANFGPFNSGLFLNAYKFYLKMIDDICFREEYSYKIFPNNNKVRIAPDIVFGYKDEFLNSDKKDKTVGVSVMNLENRDDLKKYYPSYISKVRELIKYSIENDFKVHLFSFCEEEGDEKAINDIICALDNKTKEKIEVVLYKGEIDQFLQTFSNMEFIIALRFHSFILSQIYQQSVFPIVYSRKTFNVLEDIGLANYYIDLENIDKLDIKGIFKRIKNNYIDIENISKLSENHFEKLDGFMKG